MNYFPLVSIVLEAAIAILFFAAALRGRIFLLGLTLTFAVYVFYDLSRFFAWNISENVLTGIFFVATLGALFSAVSLLKK